MKNSLIPPGALVRIENKLRDQGKEFFPKKWDHSNKFLSNITAKRTCYQTE